MVLPDAVSCEEALGLGGCGPPRRNERLMKVLITGAAGYVGRRLVAGLEREHELRLGDLNPSLPAPPWVALDVTHPESVAAAMTGIDAVIHLAIASGQEGETEDD